MNRDEAEKFMNEFNERLEKLIADNPKLTPDSPELKALIKEFNNKGLPVRIIKESDLLDGLAGMMEMLNRMGVDPKQKGKMMREDYPQEAESFETEEKPCRFHVKGLDDTNRQNEIGKRDIEDLSIDINTMSDEDIWNKYFK